MLPPKVAFASLQGDVAEFLFMCDSGRFCVLSLNKLSTKNIFHVEIQAN